ncbi:MAG TPA: glycosyltransferase family 1 protein [Cyclobacteriaceae bacterium]
MRIGFDAKRLFNNFTGLGNYSRFVVNALNEYHPENNYTLYTPKVKSNRDTEYFLNKENLTIKSPEGLQKKISSIWRSYSLGNVAANDGVKLFHGLSNELPLTKPKNIRTLVTIHDVIFKRYPEFYKPIDRVIYDWKFKKACESADQIIAVSQQTANDVIEFLQATPSKVQTVYQGCHPMFQASYSSDQVHLVKQKYNLPDEFILNVGTIESRKNALIILKALVIIKERIQLVIVGRPTAYKDELTKFITENKLTDQVTFIHQAEFTDLPLIYQAANAFVYPSFFEGFGIPIIEAIASGIPVITSTGSCFSEAGGPDCWYVNPSQSEELAAEIQKVFTNDSEVRQRVERSLQYIKRFEPKVIADNLTTIYKSLS